MLTTIIIIAIFTRFRELYHFLKMISRVYKRYDINYVDKHRHLLNEFSQINYEKHSYWSGYRFLVLDGPNLYNLFFSSKKLDIYNIYNESIINKLREYEAI